MAFAAAIKAVLSRSALAKIASRGRLIPERQLTRWLMRQHPQIKDQSYQAFQAVARQTRLMYQAGRRLQKSPVARPRGRDVPRDPSIEDGGANYSYRVVVSGYTPTGRRIATAVTVLSDSPLTRAEVQMVARGMFEQSDSPYRNDRPGTAQVERGANLIFEIISAGRR